MQLCMSCCVYVGTDLIEIVRLQGGIAESDHAHCDTCHHSVVCLSVFKPPPPVGAGGGYMFSGRPPCVRPCVRP